MLFAKDTISNQIDNKYGKLSSIIYVNNSSSYNEVQNKLTSLGGVSEIVEKAMYVVKIQDTKAILNVFDFNGMSKINDFHTIDNQLVKAENGVYIPNSQNIKQLTANDSIEIGLEDETITFPFGGYLDRDSYYEPSESSLLNIYVDKHLFENILGDVKDSDQFYISLNNPTMENSHKFLKDYEDYST